MMGKVQKKKKKFPKEEEWRLKAPPQGPRLEPGTYHMLGESPQLHATVTV